MTDLSIFNPNTVDELVDELRGQLSDVASDWWEANQDLVSGYLRSLAEATLQTRIALAAGRISENTADILMHSQELAFNQTLQFSRFMTFVLAQKLLDTVFSVVAWVIYNRTGINLFPDRVKPDAQG